MTLRDNETQEVLLEDKVLGRRGAKSEIESAVEGDRKSRTKWIQRMRPAGKCKLTSSLRLRLTRNLA